MKRTLVLGTLLALTLAPYRLEAAAPASAQSKQQSQLRTRAMARELLSSVLDVQLAKLEVNGLAHLPIYHEIASMRKNIDRLVENEMSEIVDMLAKAQEGADEHRQARQQAVREKARDVAIRLSVERQNVLRRLKIFDLTAQVRRLIDMQQTLLQRTEALGNDKPALLSAVQDQCDIKTLFNQLFKAVREVSTWGGTEGATATEGMRVLKNGKVSEELDGAQTALELGNFSGAVVRQRAAIKGLSALLEKIEPGREAKNNDLDAVLNQVRQVIQSQSDLRKNTQKTPLTNETATPLIQEQDNIHKLLDQLESNLERVPAAAPLVRQAKSSALDATSNLLAAKQNEAVAEQGKVLQVEMKETATSENSQSRPFQRCFV